MSAFTAFFVNIITSLVLLFTSLLNTLSGAGAITETAARVNGSLACTDAPGRSVASAAQSEKQVGVFYFLWQGQHGSERLADNTKIVARNPQAINSEEEWLAAGGGNVGDHHFWGEPLLGYYTSDDTWVFRKHLQLLTDASVDFIVFDTTNAFTYSQQAKKLIAVWYEYLLDGWDVPQLAFYTNSASGDTMNRIYDEIYNNAALNAQYPRLSELWFTLDGKPLIIGNAQDEALRAEVKDYFRIKANQWPNEDKKADGFPWMEFDRSLTYKAVYSSGGTKIMNVSVAQHSDTCTFSKTAWYGANDRTRSWHDGANDTAPDAVLHGYNFAEQWEFAIKMDPDIIFVTGFNEWVAQRQPAQAEAPVVFVDCADENTSRDVEPSAGVMGDNYYLQMVNYIAQFKKSTSRVEKGEGVAINIDGGFGQWNSDKITAVYRDYANDTADRNAKGFGGVTYTDYSGRNDIINMKVTHDGGNCYFYIETAQALTEPSESGWMTLFINDSIVINRTAPQNGRTAVEEKTENGYRKIGEAQIRFEGNKLMLSVPETVSELRDGFSFKWADNCNADDVYSFYTSGDSAPYGRLCYQY